MKLMTKVLLGALGTTFLGFAALAEDAPRTTKTSRATSFIETLPIENKSGRMTVSVSATIVCADFSMMDKAFGLQETGNGDMLQDLNCRYLREGSQGSRIDWLRPYNQIVLRTPNGPLVVWSHREHFSGPES